MGLSDYLGRFWYSSEPMFGVIMVVCFTSVLRAYPTWLNRSWGRSSSLPLSAVLHGGWWTTYFMLGRLVICFYKKKKLQAQAQAGDKEGTQW